MDQFTIIFAIGLDILMIIYTLWVVSLNRNGKMSWIIGFIMILWLWVIHFLLSWRIIFPESINWFIFLMIIFWYVWFIWIVWCLIPGVRKLISELSQEQLLLMQWVRVFFGANFLMLAAYELLPTLFGVIDGWTHISAGFFALIAAFTVSKKIYANSRVLFANIFGLVDIIIVASTIALVLLPVITPYSAMMYAVFLPAPLWFWFHIVSLYRVFRGK